MTTAVSFIRHYENETEPYIVGGWTKRCFDERVNTYSRLFKHESWCMGWGGSYQWWCRWLVQQLQQTVWSWYQPLSRWCHSQLLLPETSKWEWSASIWRWQAMGHWWWNLSGAGKVFSLQLLNTANDSISYSDQLGRNYINVSLIGLIVVTLVIGLPLNYQGHLGCYWTTKFTLT